MTPDVALSPAGPASAESPAATRKAWRLRRLEGVLVAAVMTLPIAVYLWVALHRIGYPFELDWMEGGSVELTARVVAGHSLYSAPSIAFVGWTYPPLYYWITAAVARLTGLGFLPLRLVSLIASLGVMATLAWIVRRETGDRLAALVAAGLFAATYRISGAWFDIGRVDSLFLALTLVALAWGRWARGVRGGIGLGALVFVASFTKQTAVLALLPALGYLALTRRRVGISALLTLGTLLIASTATLDALTDGWYRYYVVSELSHQPWAHQEWAGFWTDDVLRPQWPLILIVVAAGLSLAGRDSARPALRSGSVYYLIAAVGLIGSAWVSRLHTGGYANVLMPAYAAIALLAGLAYTRLRHGRHARIAGPLLAATLLLQLGLLAYPVGAQIPTARDRAAGTALIARLRTLPGPVIVLRHPWYATVAGKGTFAQAEAISDVLRSAASRGARAMRASLRDALDANRVQAVVLDGTFDAHFFGSELIREFRLQPGPITSSRLNPLTDVRTSPTLLYVRIRPHHGFPHLPQRASQ